MMDAFLKRRLAMTMNHGVQQEHLVLWKEGKNTETYVIILNMSGGTNIPHCAKKGVCDEDCEYMKNFKG